MTLLDQVQAAPLALPWPQVRCAKCRGMHSMVKYRRRPSRAKTERGRREALARLSRVKPYKHCAGCRADEARRRQRANAQAKAEAGGVFPRVPLGRYMASLPPMSQALTRPWSA